MHLQYLKVFGRSSNLGHARTQHALWIKFTKNVLI